MYHVALPSTLIKGARDLFQPRLFDRVTIDTPSTGQLEGQFLAVAKRLLMLKNVVGYRYGTVKDILLVPFLVLTVTILELWMRIGTHGKWFQLW